MNYMASEVVRNYFVDCSETSVALLIEIVELASRGNWLAGRDSWGIQVLLCFYSAQKNKLSAPEEGQNFPPMAKSQIPMTAL